jgi:hypothetical protein
MGIDLHDLVHKDNVRVTSQLKTGIASGVFAVQSRFR